MFLLIKGEIKGSEWRNRKRKTFVSPGAAGSVGIQDVFKMREMLG